MTDLPVQTLLRASAPAVVALCTAAALLAVAANFLLAPDRATIRIEKRSPVATGTMLGFFAVLYVLLRFHVGEVRLAAPLADGMLDAGLALLVLGTAVNVLGRLSLGKQWGDHVVLYKEHAFITGGVYRWVRHPLYASLVWMACGAALVFGNAAALVATLAVFLPAMIFRARQEEAALEALFPGYAAYRRRTGMLLPRPWPRK